MGTTLTGTTPQDTYEALIKVGDNGIITGSLKTLSDGEGHDTALALSTGAASVTGTLAVTTGTNLATASGSVGIGTAAPSEKLQIQGNVVVNKDSTSANFVSKTFTTGHAVANRNGSILFGMNDSAATGMKITTSAASNPSFNKQEIEFITHEGGSSVGTRLFINSTGNVGIGTSAPTTKLTIDTAATAATRAIDMVGNSSTAKGHLGYFADAVYLSSNYFFDSGQNNDVSGLGQALVVVQASAGSASKINFNTSAAGSTTTTQRASIDADGLKFGADTAAANALDDYEEGTWTMGVAFGGASVGVTTSLNGGTYTKIGRQVTVNGLLQLTSKGSSTGNATITGLPFNAANTFGNYATASLRFSGVTFTNQFQGFAAGNTAIIELEETTILGVTSALTDADIANNTIIIVSLTYFV